MPTSTPLRRSTRGVAPIISPQKPVTGRHTDEWHEKTHSRQTRPDEDLPPNDKELDEDFEWETVFHWGFTRTYPKSNRRFKSKSRSSKNEDLEEQDEFEIGDVVLVKGLRKEDSVGVIVALWEVKPVENELAEEWRMDKMLVKVHWFLLQNELSRVSAPRKHRDDEIYYTTDQTSILPIHTLLFRCKISTGHREGTPTTSKNQDGKKRSGITSEKVYSCDTAFKNGFFYKFDWRSHRQSALQTYENASLGDEDFPDKVWNVEVKKSAQRKEKPLLAESSKSPTKRARKESLMDATPPKPKKIRTNFEARSQSAASKASSSKYRSDDGEDSHEESVSDASDDYEQASSEEEVMKDDMMEESDEEHPGEQSEEDEDEDGKHKSPRKRQSQSSRKPPRTPRRSRTKRIKATPTPSSKEAMVARKRGRKIRIDRGGTFGSADADREAMMKLPKDPYLRAMHLLHVAARPDALPGRDAEFDEILGSVLRVLEEGSGGCIYISGVPGTGKTATVHAVVRELQKMAINNETNPFTYVEINGLRLPEPTAAYAVLWEAVSGHDSAKDGHLKISSKEALKQLDRYFSGGRMGPSAGAYVVLMDELDQLVTAKQDVVYNFFNWPNLPQSKLVVIAVSNTHDLPERVMSGKVRSRLGMERIQFQPYSRDQLKDIVTSRLEASREGLDTTENVMHPDAVLLAASRIAAVTGDARRVLDISRRSVETVYNPEGTSKIVTATVVQQVIRAMQNSPNAAYLKECSFAERLVLAALMKCSRREGVNEIKWGDVTLQCHVLFDQLRDSIMTRPSVDHLRIVLRSLVSARAVLMENGVAADRKAFQDRLLLMNIENGEATRALCDVGGPKWVTLLGA